MMIDAIDQSTIDQIEDLLHVRVPFGKYEGYLLMDVQITYADKEITKWQRTLFVRQVEELVGFIDSLFRLGNRGCFEVRNADYGVTLGEVVEIGLQNIPSVRLLNREG